MLFNYVLDEKKSWPPKVRPKPPFGPTAIEVMRSCKLRICFEASPNYERRLGGSARIGTVLHRTLQSLNQQPIVAETTEQLAAETRRRFQTELTEQQNQAASRPREKNLAWDHERTNRALDAVIAEAIRTQPLRNKGSFSNSWKAKQITSKSNVEAASSYSTATTEVEIEVHSKNHLFYGRVDRAEKTENGIRLVDYKSAFRDDLPGRYARQLQLYAYLWFETRGEWPTEAFVFYPMVGSFHSVAVDETTCLQVASESTELVEEVTKTDRIASLASPGDICKVCEFRPWCRPFWLSQTIENKHMRALELAAIGFEGPIESITLTNHYWRIIIAWRNAKVKLIAPQERFPHLTAARVGQTLRVLDSPLRGQLYEPSAFTNEYTEIFLLSQ